VQRLVHRRGCHVVRSDNWLLCLSYAANFLAPKIQSQLPLPSLCAQPQT
jgi:hypothetical protein